MKPMYYYKNSLIDSLFISLVESSYYTLAQPVNQAPLMGM